MNIREFIAGVQLQQLIVLAIFLSAFLFQMGIYFFVFLKLPRYRKEKKTTDFPGITVLICARNEESNLERFLPVILSQDYPEFEVVVVNDSSTDDTEQLLMQMASLASVGNQIFQVNIPFTLLSVDLNPTGPHMQ